MKRIFLMRIPLGIIVILLLSAADSEAYYGSPCIEKMNAANSARKAFDYCLQAWAQFTEPTDPEPDSCASKLQQYENFVKEQRACLKKSRDQQ